MLKLRKITSLLTLAVVFFTSSIVFADSPVAVIAGEDQTLTATSSGFVTVTLDGSGSYDPDQGDFILDWTWVNGFPATSGAVVTIDLPVGVHVITLTVTDSESPVGNTGTDTITITVLAPQSDCPVITTPAQNVQVECDGLGDNTAIQAWLLNNGSAVATAASGTITWSNNYQPGNFIFDSPNCASGHITVVFTATANGCSISTQATFTVVDTTAPTLVWYVEGQQVGDAATYNISNKDIPITVKVVPVDLCSGATLNKFVKSTVSGAATVTFTADTFYITAAQTNSSIRFCAQATDGCGNVSAQEWVTIKVVVPGKADVLAKGNEGLGNGVDPNTPGHIHNGGNDDPQWSPGNPGARTKSPRF